MRILLHHNPQQSGACLDSLVDYAYEIERSALARNFKRLDTFVAWLQLQPVKLDLGEAPQRSGCNPTQRSRIWPSDGFNCWEATAHFLGVAIALNIAEVVHLFDVTKDGVRHVFPALQDPLQARPEIPIQLQKFGMFAPRAGSVGCWVCSGVRAQGLPRAGFRLASRSVSRPTGSRPGRLGIEFQSTSRRGASRVRASELHRRPSNVYRKRQLVGQAQRLDDVGDCKESLIPLLSSRSRLFNCRF